VVRRTAALAAVVLRNQHRLNLLWVSDATCAASSVADAGGGQVVADEERSVV